MQAALSVLTAERSRRMLAVIDRRHSPRCATAIAISWPHGGERSDPKQNRTRRADTLVWFAGFNCGDPLRWSPTKIEFLLLDWWHRKVVQSEDADRELPRILRAFVRWSGQQKGVPARFVDQNLAAIDAFEPAFLADIGTPRRNTAAELARLVAGIPGDVDDDAYDEDEDLSGSLLAVLADRVGGWDVLDDLAATPLPDEPLDVDGVDPDILPAVHAAAHALDTEITSRGLPDATELRTAGRRLVRRLALTDPAAWRRKATPASTACAIAYLLYLRDRWRDL